MVNDDNFRIRKPSFSTDLKQEMRTRSTSTRRPTPGDDLREPRYEALEIVGRRQGLETAEGTRQRCKQGKTSEGEETGGREKGLLK